MSKETVFGRDMRAYDNNTSITSVITIINIKIKKFIYDIHKHLILRFIQRVRTALQSCEQRELLFFLLCGEKVPGYFRRRDEKWGYCDFPHHVSSWRPPQPCVLHNNIS